MNVKSLNDQQLHRNLLALKSKESHIVACIISHLEEVYRRRLFSDYKCSSIYDYCIRILGYSNGEAHKKISACKLASQCEGVKESIANGSLSLSNAASIQVFLNQSARSLRSKNNDMSSKQIGVALEGADQDKKFSNCTSGQDHALSDCTTDQDKRSSKCTTDHDKRMLSCATDHSVKFTSTNFASPKRSLDPQQIIERVKNKNTQECEIELEKIASENHLELPERKVSKRNYGDKTLLKVYLDRNKLQLLKSRLNISCEQELLQTLIEEKVKSTEPQTEIKSKTRKQSNQCIQSGQNGQNGQSNLGNQSNLSKPLAQKPRSISPSKRAAVFKRAQKKCENCGSKYHLQVDHKVSVAKGGGNEVENLRVLCRPCNQRAAIDQLGFATMDKFINQKLINKSSNNRKFTDSRPKQATKPAAISTPSEGQVALNI